MKMQFSPLHEGEIHQACQLMCSNIPENVYQLTIFASPGYPEYLKAVTRCGSHSTTFLIGAYIDNELVGFAEWRWMEEMLVLNNLHVDAAFQKAGVGGRLITYGEQLALKDGVHKLALDVFSWNEYVHAWYLRLGFVEEGRTYWYIKKLKSSFGLDRPDIPYIIEDYPMAEVHHEKYGFSSLRIRTKQNISTVGRLGKQYFRIQLKCGEWNGGHELTDVLFDIDDKRQLLILSPEAYLREKDPELILNTESIRMIKLLGSQEVKYE